MLKRIKIPLIIVACLGTYWFFLSGNDDPLPNVLYTIEHYHEDGCEIYRELGDLATKRGDYKQAHTFYQKALSYKSDSLTTQDHLGCMYEEKNDPNNALKTYFKAMSISPNFIEERFKKDIPLDIETSSDFEIIKQKPQWTGQPLKCKTILIYTAKGFGNTLQFVRFLPLLEQQGATVLFKPQKQLASLFETSEVGATIITGQLNSEKHIFDYQASLLSLPHYLDVNFEQCMMNKKYLQTTPEHVTKFKNLFNPKTLNIGIAWQGNPTHINDKNRSIPLSFFYNVARLPGVQVYSLQKYAGHEQLEDAPDDVSIIDLDGLIQSFDDTAALIENLDLVISVDSAIAHLAGALDKKVWMLTPHITDWRWLGSYEKDQSIWYKHLRKFRQDSPGAWHPVFNRITAQLRREVEQKS